MAAYRKRICTNLYFVAEQIDDRGWNVKVVDTFDRPVDKALRIKALYMALLEVSSLRSHLWHKEIPNAQDE